MTAQPPPSHQSVAFGRSQGAPAVQEPAVPMFRQRQEPVATPPASDPPPMSEPVNDIKRALLRKPVSAVQAEPELATTEPDQDRRDNNQPSERMIGRVSFCSGSRAIVSTTASRLTGAAADFWSVGKLISIEAPGARIVALVCEILTGSGSWVEGSQNSISIVCELVGEVTIIRGSLGFKRGVSNYPALGAVAHRIRARDLEAMHDLGEKKTIEIGTLSQNSDIAAKVAIEDLLRRHFAVLGTTGVGKSCTVTLLVRRAVQVVKSLRVLMLDPHNEFLGGLGDIAVGLDVDDLNLPYWLFRFEELEEVVFKGRRNEEEADILRELVSVAKAMRAEGGGARTKPGDHAWLTADTPVPYRMTDVLSQIDEILGQLEPRFDRSLLKSL